MSMAFRVHGLDCAEEVALLKREVGPVVGGEEHLSFDILNAKMTVAGNRVAAPAIVSAVQRTGMRAEPWQQEHAAPRSETFWQRHQRRILTAISGTATCAAWLTHAIAGGGWRAALGADSVAHAQPPAAAVLLYTVAILAAMWLVLPKAFLSLRRLRFDMNLLMTLAVIGAVAIGEWFEAATVSLLFSISLLLESWSVRRARDEIAALLNLAPPVARLRLNGHGEREVSPAEVPIGSLIVVKPGERLPLDGRIHEGTSHVNQAPITGESQPVSKEAGDEVFAGTINGDGALIVETTRAAGETILASIVRMVGEAHSRRAPTERWVERFASRYTPAVIVLAVIVGCLPPLVFGASWSEWFYNALVLLVIACPCALVISTPVTIVSGLAAAARNGVLIKGGEYLELPARLNAIAFDKTGTLTVGRPKVIEVIPLAGHSTTELLERAAALEQRSEHPLGAAIVEYARQCDVRPVPAEGFKVLQGRGATASFDGRQFWIGSHRYLKERGQETAELSARLEALEARGHSVVVIGNEQHVCGVFALADQVSPGTPAALARLRTLGIQHLVMLTGDNEATARAIALECGIDEFEAALLPADKLAAVERLVAEYGAVAMVGDGVNDAPALARATLGIAMGAAGSDAAIETADIALMAGDLGRVPWLIEHARRTLRILRENIAFSLGTKAVFVLLTLAGSASLWSAIAADMGASLLVTFNGLRLLGAAPGARRERAVTEHARDR